MKKSTNLLAPALLSALLTTGVLSAADIEWSGSEDSEWSNAANWQGDALPGESDNAIIGGGSSADFNYPSGSQKVNSLNVAGGQKTVLNINSGKLEVYNTTSPETRVLKVGYDEGTSGEINIGGASESDYGMLELNSALYTHAYLGYAGLGVINVTGYGKLNFLCNSYSNGYFTLGGGNTSESPNGTGILNLSGNSEAYFEVAKQGVVSVGGKAVNGGNFTMEEAIRASRNASSTAVINLNGGVAQTRGVLAGGGSSELNFNGGTLKAASNAYNADGSRFVNSVQINLLGNGGTIDTNGQNLAIAALVTGSGDLRKDGAGILTFMQANSMTCDLIVDRGGVLAAHTDAFGASNLVVNSGATADTSVALANVGGVELSGGILNANGANVGSYNVSGGNFVMNSGTLQLTIADPDSFDTFFGDGDNEFLIYAGVLELVIADIDYNRTYAIFKNFVGGMVMDALQITGYDTDNYTAVLGEDGVLSFVAVPEPAQVAALLGLFAIALGIWRRRK